MAWLLQTVIYIPSLSEKRFILSPPMKRETTWVQEWRETGGSRETAVFGPVSPCVRLCRQGWGESPCQEINGCVRRLSPVLGWGGVWGSVSRIAPAYNKEKEAPPFHPSTGGKDCLEECGWRKNCVA